MKKTIHIKFNLGVFATSRSQIKKNIDCINIQNATEKWFWDPLWNMTKGEQKADNTLQKIWSGKYNH